jgi:predicted transcriptional regulator
MDAIYINEAKRIRIEYLKNIAFILRKEVDIQSSIARLSEIKNEIETTDDKSEEFFREKLQEVDRNITEAKEHIMPFYDKIEQLNKDQHNLYVTIKDKYQGISDEEIRSEVIEHIQGIDVDFMTRNPDVLELINKK